MELKVMRLQDGMRMKPAMSRLSSMKKKWETRTLLFTLSGSHNVAE